MVLNSQQKPMCWRRCMEANTACGITSSALPCPSTGSSLCGPSQKSRPSSASASEPSCLSSIRPKERTEAASLTTTSSSPNMTRQAVCCPPRTAISGKRRFRGASRSSSATRSSAADTTARSSPPYGGTAGPTLPRGCSRHSANSDHELLLPDRPTATQCDRGSTCPRWCMSYGSFREARPKGYLQHWPLWNAVTRSASDWENGGMAEVLNPSSLSALMVGFSPMPLGR